MPSITKLFNQIKLDFADYTFVEGRDFMWSSTLGQITYKKPMNLTDIWTLLHELGHAKLGHNTYSLDIELIQREVAAWEYAQRVLGPRYSVKIDSEHIEEHLDTYRLWLHQRSLCPQCQQNGFQITQNTYSCSNCRCLWRVNEARVYRLRRTRLRAQDRFILQP